jgi:RNA polymerase sigma-70 factor (TIGR02960 family)
MGGTVAPDDLLARARAGDGEAFRALVEPFRHELQVHCYRMLGSLHDAEDLLQDTLLAAWRAIGGYEQRASVRTWLYRIATNRCLNALRGSARRDRVVEPPREPLPEPTRRGEPSWLEPYPDALLVDPAPGPEARYEARESVSLAFVAALQQLPARQRAVLVLRDVLGFRAREVAELLDASEDAVASALARARRALPSPADWTSAPLPDSPQERRIVEEFSRAFEADDVDAVVAMLTDDAWLTMPPLPFEYQGPIDIAHFLGVMAFNPGREHTLVPTRANRQPAFGMYVREPGSAIRHGRGLLVLTLRRKRIAALTRFSDCSVLPAFGLPRSLGVQ